MVRAVSDTSERGVPPDLAAVVRRRRPVRTLSAVSAVLAARCAAADAMALRTTTNAALKVIAQASAHRASAMSTIEQRLIEGATALPALPERNGGLGGPSAPPIL